MSSTAKAYGGKRQNQDYDTDAWVTPARVFDPLHERFNFTIDLFADDKNHKLPLYFTKKDDALKQSWSGHRGFANPPFSIVASCLEKARQEAIKNDGFTIFIVKADTSTEWWKAHWAFVERYMRAGEGTPFYVEFLKRIQFDPPPGYTGNCKSPNMGHALLFNGIDPLKYTDQDLEWLSESLVQKVKRILRW